MHTILSEIKNADGNLIEAIMKAVLQRYAELFPDWEISTISLEKSKDRDEQLDRMIAALAQMKNVQERK